METKIELENGKYTILHENGNNLRALRYGKPWRTLVGDNLILAMAAEIEKLQQCLIQNEKN
jgi:hypothetical protein